MNYKLFIARRYLFSKKKHHAINIISFISMLGVMVGCMALICTLSVFNGFRGVIESVFTDFDPDLKITRCDGSYISEKAGVVTLLRKSADVAVVTPVIEEPALVVREGRQEVVCLKGVADNFLEQGNIQEVLYGEGEPMLHADVLDFAIPGIGLSNKLGLSLHYDAPLELYAPKKGEQINMANPMTSFNSEELYSSGLVFMMHQEKYDANYILCSLNFAQRLFDRKGEYSAIEVRLKVDGRKGSIQALLGDEYKVADRYEQQEDLFRVMQVEKLIAFLFLSFILLIASLNIVGSLTMLILDKKKDIETLRSLGCSVADVRGVFCREGYMIIGAGTVLGTALGLVICYIQQTYGVVRMGAGEGSYIIDAYPVLVEPLDIILVFSAVVILGGSAVFFTVKRVLPTEK